MLIGLKKQVKGNWIYRYAYNNTIARNTVFILDLKEARLHVWKKEHVYNRWIIMHMEILRHKWDFYSIGTEVIVVDVDYTAIRFLEEGLGVRIEW